MPPDAPHNTHERDREQDHDTPHRARQGRPCKGQIRLYITARIHRPSINQDHDTPHRARQGRPCKGQIRLYITARIHRPSINQSKTTTPPTGLDRVDPVRGKFDSTSLHGSTVHPSTRARPRHPHRARQGRPCKGQIRLYITARIHRPSINQSKTTTPPPGSTGSTL
jgi:hypothetical protein